MQIGKQPPQWAQDLIFKWIHLDDEYMGMVHNVFVLYADLLEEDKIRIFAQTEECARNPPGVKSQSGLFTTFIKQSNYKIIGVPTGLEDWTRETISIEGSPIDPIC